MKLQAQQSITNREVQSTSDVGLQIPSTIHFTNNIIIRVTTKAKNKNMSTIRGPQEEIYLRIISYNQPAYSDVIFARSENIN